MSEELKSCPHCGSTATLFSNYNAKTRKFYIYVKCDLCGAQGKCTASVTDPDETEWNDSACNASIAAWNMRRG